MTHISGQVDTLRGRLIHMALQVDTCGRAGQLRQAILKLNSRFSNTMLFIFIVI